jgi:diacylglycerol kinase (ATP)
MLGAVFIVQATGKVLILVNPASGRGAAATIRPAVEDYFRSQQFPAHFVTTQSAADLEQRAACAAGEGYSCVAVLGGDGTFHFLLRGAFGTNIPLGILPAGSGNDIAMGLGIPLDPPAAAASLIRSTPRAVDVVRVRFADGSERVFIGAGGIGLDAEANQLATGRFRRLPGVTRYIAGALAALRRAEPLRLTAEFDDGSWQGEVLFAAVANSPTYGAGVQIAPDARMDDGLLNLVLVEPLSLARVLEAIPIVLRDGDLRWPQVHRFTTKRLLLRPEKNSPFHGDGEILGEAPAEFQILPESVQVMVPAGQT